MIATPRLTTMRPTIMRPPPMLGPAIPGPMTGVVGFGKAVASAIFNTLTVVNLTLYFCRR
ncbi:MAG: hypothetical protein ACR2JQ_05460 [Mycobacteriales bacterium]